MIENEIIIPEGWTYFSHRTNTERWEKNPFISNEIVVKKVMSVVTEHEIYQELRDYGPKKLSGYDSGKGIPFEIRCLICDLHYIQTLDKNFELRNVMLNKFYYDRDNFGGAFGQRHHSIPRNEELVVIATSNYDEVFKRKSNIIWTIPKRFIDFYNSELHKKNNRYISLESQEEEIQL